MFDFFGKKKIALLETQNARLRQTLEDLDNARVEESQEIANQAHELRVQLNKAEEQYGIIIGQKDSCIKELEEKLSVFESRGKFVVYGRGKYAFRLRDDNQSQDAVVVVNGTSKNDARENFKRVVSNPHWRVLDIKKIEEEK